MSPELAGRMAALGRAGAAFHAALEAAGDAAIAEAEQEGDAVLAMLVIDVASGWSRVFEVLERALEQGLADR